MCVAVPFQVKSLKNDYAQVESFGVVMDVNIALLSQVKPGDYLLIHAGFAIAMLSNEAGTEIVKILEEIN